MSLRLKLTILLGLVIAVTLAFSTSTVYWIARGELEKGAVERLQHTAWLVSAQIEERFRILLQSFETYAQTPIVKDVAMSPDDPRLVERANRFFAVIVRNSGILQTVNLFDGKAACIASSIPERLGKQYVQDVVEKRKDFLAAREGKTMINGPFMGLSSAQPAIALSVPVTENDRVIGVLRPIVDIAEFNRNFLKPLAKSQEGRVFILAPGLDSRGNFKPLDPDLTVTTPYVHSGVPVQAEMLQEKKGLVQYRSKGVPRYAAFQSLDMPRVLVVVEIPLSQVLAPIQHTKYAALVIALIMLALIWFSAGFAIRPLLANLRKCLEFIRAIRDGDMKKRIPVTGRDDVAELASGLNEMAERLHIQHAELRQSEIKYRSIFETTVEGIFQTTEDGRFLTANPALAGILGTDSWDRLLDCRVDQFYADPRQRRAILDALKQHGKVSRYELDVKRLDGELRKCLVDAHAQLDEDGRIIMMQGIMHDVTDERQAEAAREQAEKAERLAIEARFQALRYQVNPHFLFNVLNTIDYLSRKSPEQIPYLLQQLSSYLRQTLKPKTEMTSLLDEEIQSIKAYLAIEQIRFHRNLTVAYHIAPDAADIILPEMLLQPLVENAVKYGMGTSGMPLRIVIRADIHESRLHVSVSNTGCWVVPDPSRPDRSGIGLANLRERLRIFYHDDFSMETGEADGWVSIGIRLPLIPLFSLQSQKQNPVCRDLSLCLADSSPNLADSHQRD